MTAELARMRITKIRNELSYSRNDLNNKLGLRSNNEDSQIVYANDWSLIK